jgi:hypothetical protein
MEAASLRFGEIGKIADLLCNSDCASLCRLPSNFNVTINPLRTDGDFCHQGQHTEITHQNLRSLKPTNTTIHWKALEEHFLMTPLVFDSTIFMGNVLNFSKKKP